MSSSRHRTANSSGVIPSAFTASGSAPYVSSKSAIDLRRCCTAKCKGKAPVSSRVFALAPAVSNDCVMAFDPLRTARCSRLSSDELFLVLTSAGLKIARVSKFVSGCSEKLGVW